MRIWAYRAAFLVALLLSTFGFVKWVQPMLLSCALQWAQADGYPEKLAKLNLELVQREAAFGANHPAVADYLEASGWTAYDGGRIAQAESYFRRVLDIRSELLQPGDPAYAKAQLNLADFYKTFYRNMRAIEHYKQYLEALERHGEVNVHTRRQTLGEIADIYYRTGQYDKAVDYYHQMAEGDHAETLGALQKIAAIYSREDRYSDAAGVYHRMIEVMKKQNRYQRDRFAANIHRSLAEALLKTDAAFQAKEHLQIAEDYFLSALEDSRGTRFENPASAAALADLLSKQQRYEEAERYYREALETPGDLGIPDPNAFQGLTNLLAEQGRYEEIDEMYNAIKKLVPDEPEHEHLHQAFKLIYRPATTARDAAIPTGQ